MLFDSSAVCCFRAEAGTLHLSLGANKSELCAVADGTSTRIHVVTKSASQCRFHREILVQAARLLATEPTATIAEVKMVVDQYAKELR
jgi:c-di-GMP-binding flagellar brake protein YcgR